MSKQQKKEDSTNKTSQGKGRGSQQIQGRTGSGKPKQDRQGKSSRPDTSCIEKSKGQDKDKNGYPDTSGANDFAWHCPDAGLLERASETSWSYQTGELVHLGDTYAALPGLMNIFIKPSFGGLGTIGPNTIEDPEMSPTYEAANSLMAELRSRIKVRNTYDAPDLLILMLAMAYIYAGIFLAKRLVNSVKMFTYQNEYLPNALFKAQGFNYAWFRDNYYDFVSDLDVFIAEVNKVYVPATMPFFKLLNERFSNYYTEGTDIKDQIYMFTPAMLCKITYSKTTDYAAALQPIMIIPGEVTNASDQRTKYNASATYTGDQLILTLRRMLSAVVNHDSTADITGDLMNAFGPSMKFTIEGVTPGTTVPVFDEEILESIHNLVYSVSVRGTYLSYDSTDTQASIPLPFCTLQLPTTNQIGDWDSYLVSKTNADRDFNIISKHHIIDVHSDPNARKTFNVCRFRNRINSARVPVGSDQYWIQVECGSDLVCNVVYWTYDNGVGYSPYDATSIIRLNGDYTSKMAAVISVFHYHPLMILLAANSDEWCPNSWLFGSTDIYAEITDKQIQRQDRISLLSLLGAWTVDAPIK